MNFFSCCRKFVHCWAFLKELMFSSYLRCWVMMVPREKTQCQLGSHRGSWGQVGLGFYWNPLPSPWVVLSAPNSRSAVCRWTRSHQRRARGGRRRLPTWGAWRIHVHLHTDMSCKLASHMHTDPRTHQELHFPPFSLLLPLVSVCFWSWFVKPEDSHKFETNLKHFHLVQMCQCMGLRCLEQISVCLHQLTFFCYLHMQ